MLYGITYILAGVLTAQVLSAAVPLTPGGVLRTAAFWPLVLLLVVVDRWTSR